MVFGFEPYHPAGISSFASYFTLKILPFEVPSPMGGSLPHDRPWGGYGYYLELQNTKQRCPVKRPKFLKNVGNKRKFKETVSD